MAGIAHPAQLGYERDGKPPDATAFTANAARAARRLLDAPSPPAAMTAHHCA
jgi:hypothetical protein